MSFLLKLGRWAIGNSLVRAYILKLVRNAMVGSGPVLTAWLLHHGVTDAAGINAFLAYATGTVVTGVGLAFSLYDAQAVTTEQHAAVTTAVQKAVDAAHSERPLTPEQIDAALGTLKL